MNMKNITIRLLTMIILIGFFMSITGSAVAQGIDTSGDGITIDDNWIFITQQNNHKTLNIRENIWFNNTGTNTFSGQYYFWLPEGAKVVATCCNADDMMCVIKPDDSHGCVNINARYDANVISGNPFGLFTSHQTYFGQTENIVINGTFLDNKSNPDKDQLTLKAVVGGSTHKRVEDVPSGKNVELSSKNDIIGVTFKSITNSYFMVVTDSIDIRNNDNVTRQVDLNIESIPTGWYLTLVENGTNVLVENNVFKNPLNVSANSTKNIEMFFSVPSHLMSMMLEYSVEIPVSGGDAKAGLFEMKGEETVTGIFEKESMYETLRIFPVITQLEGDNVEISPNLRKMDYVNPDSENTVYYYGTSLSASDKISINLQWEEEVKNYTLIYLMILILIITLIVIVSLKLKMMKKRELERIENEPETPEGADDGYRESSKDSLMEKKQSLRRAIKDLDRDYENDKLPEPIYTELKSKYTKKLSQIKKQIAESKESNEELEKLYKKKEKLLAAIKRVKSDYDSGELPKDIYEELNAEYRQKTIDVMKEIDRIE